MIKQASLTCPGLQAASVALPSLLPSFIPFSPNFTYIFAFVKPKRLTVLANLCPKSLCIYIFFFDYEVPLLITCLFTSHILLSPDLVRILLEDIVKYSVRSLKASHDTRF